MQNLRSGAVAWVGVLGYTSLLALAATSPATAETITLLALGDSLTAGYGLPQGDGLVPQLQAWLTAQGVDVAVVNAGVSGDTTADGLARLDWSLTPDVDAVMVELGGNDMLRGIDPAFARANLERVVQRLTARHLPVLLIGFHAPGNYGPRYQVAFDAIYPDLAAQYQTGLVAEFFEALRGDTGRYLQSDGLHPNAKGVARIVADIGPEVKDLLSRVPSN